MAQHLTLEQVEKIPREFLIPKEVAQVLGCYAYGITLLARQDPKALGFPVIVIGNRTKIPKRAFINYMIGHPEEIADNSDTLSE